MPRRLGTMAVLTAAITAFAAAGVAAAYPPAPPGETTARQHLAALTVAAEGSMDGYDRDTLPHWSAHSGNCDSRETVLRRDGADVATGGSSKSSSARLLASPPS